MWEGRSRKKRGRPATGQGETLYIPINYREAVSQIIDEDIPESGNVYVPLKKLKEVMSVIKDDFH